MAPALRIPVALDMDSFKRQTEESASRVGSTLKVIARDFARVNGEIADASLRTANAYGGSWANAIGRVVGAITIKRTALVGAAFAMGGALQAARKQLEEMVEVGEKASRSTVSPEFFQAFTAEARKARVEVETLEQALETAFDRLKPKLDQDWSSWDVGKQKISEAEKKLREFYLELFDKSQRDPGFVQDFENAAGNLEAQIVAVLRGAVELENAGYKLQALDLLESLFPQRLVDNIRQGKTSAQEMLQTVEQMKTTAGQSGGIFSDELVERARETDRQLKVAHDTLTRNLKPAWDGLADVAVTIKGVWVEIVSLLAKAASITQVFSRDAALQQKVQRRAFLEQVLADPSTVPAQRNLRSKELERLNAELADFDRRMAAASDLARSAGIGDVGKEGVTVPLPRPRPAEMPRSVASSERDRFSSAADSIERRIAGLKAEADAIDLGTAAREKARIAAELKTVAEQANIAAGLKNTEVTAEQQATIDKLAGAYGRAAAQMENARSPLATFARESQNLGSQLNRMAADSLRSMTNELTGLVTGTQSASEAFSRMANSIINDLTRIMIQKHITGPLASSFRFGGRS